MGVNLDLSSIIKLTPKYVAAVAIACGVILFVPDTAITTLGLDAFKKAVHPWLGGTFILSCSLLLVQWAMILWRRASAKRRVRVNMRRRHQRLHALSPAEQKLLRFFISNQTRTQKLDIRDGVVGGLEAALVIYRSASVGTVFDGWDYNIQPWAYDYLIKHPEIVGITGD